MKYVSWRASLLAAALLAFLPSTHANAQATRTWVSGVGDDVNPCSRTAPCKTFAGAISKTAAGGEINCIDAGAYGAVTITKAMTIDCADVKAGVLVSGSNGITVSAGASDVVTLRGLDIFGAPPPSASANNGIVFNTGAALHVEKTVIRQFFTQSPYPIGFGILFKPTGTSELYISDTYITNNGAGSAGGAVMVRPTGTGSAKGVISSSNFDNNVTGITLDGGSTTGSVTIDVRDTVSSGAPFTGISIVTPASGGGQTGLMLERSMVTNNVTGVSSFGPKSTVLLSGSTVVGNNTGLAPSSGGSILSYQNNNLTGNVVSDGAPTGTVNLK
ncbi:MAG: right-handed parallel beta-helix repeat-containing protein [Proteobacteria bacterium]|nr:right-handed parallel beta-helix repeat-containing protein [Pseudomonadota bacterium]